MSTAGVSGSSSCVCLIWRLLLTPLRSYIEGIVRGYRNSLLSNQHYSNLTQCESIDGSLIRFPFDCLFTDML